MGNTNRFFKQLRENSADGKIICVGLDSDLRRIKKCRPDGGLDSERIFAFNQSIIKATCDTAAAYKFNTAFYRAEGGFGDLALRHSIHYIFEKSPKTPVILDSKWGDVAHVNEKHIQAAFSNDISYNADAVVINPLFGGDAIGPFLRLKDKGVLVMCRSSNPRAGDFQDHGSEHGDPLYLKIARYAQNWNMRRGNIGVVVGANSPEEMREVRKTVGRSMLILSPGLGEQGGDLEAIIKAGVNRSGQGLLVSASRSIIFASEGRGFAEAARESLLSLHKRAVACL